MRETPLSMTWVPCFRLPTNQRARSRISEIEQGGAKQRERSVDDGGKKGLEHRFLVLLTLFAILLYLDRDDKSGYGR
jgi:hypothetical protein